MAPFCVVIGFEQAVVGREGATHFIFFHVVRNCLGSVFSVASNCLHMVKTSSIIVPRLHIRRAFRTFMRE